MTKPISEKFEQDESADEQPEKFYPAQHLKIFQTSETEQLLICECRNCSTPLSIEVVFTTPQNSKPRLKGKGDTKPEDQLQCPNCGRVPIYLENCVVRSISQLPTSPWQ